MITKHRFYEPLISSTIRKESSRAIADSISECDSRDVIKLVQLMPNTVVTCEMVNLRDMLTIFEIR